MIEIDGSYGESGGAMLRQALGLSMLTGKPFRMINIRKGRPKEGLSWQHLTALNAAHRICNARVSGNSIGATIVTFEPDHVQDSKLSLDIGTAGSITLMLQTILLPALFSGKRFSVEIRGGTDVAWSIPIDYMKNVLLPQLKRFGDVDLQLIRRGYYPRGGGKVLFKSKGAFPGGRYAPRILLERRGEVLKINGISHASKDLQPSEVADRQSDAAKLILNGRKIPIDILTSYVDADCSGSGITLWAMCGSDGGFNHDNPVIIGSDGLGERKLKAEDVGKEAADNLSRLLDEDVPCDEYLADQLIPILGLVGGKIITNKISDHTKSNIYVTEKFLDVKFVIDEDNNSIMVNKE